MKTTGIVPLFCLFLLLENTIPAGAQSVTGQTRNNDPYAYAGFNPTVVIIIVIALTSLFFMVFFAIYVRECSGRSSTGLLPQYTRSINVARGLDRATVETFPVFTYAEVKEHKIVTGGMECAVCLNEFEDHEMLRLIPKCDHVFHPECIDAWLASHVTCPVCRADLALEPGNEPTRASDATCNSVTEDCCNRTVHGSSSRNDEIMVQVEEENQGSNQSSGPRVFGVGKFRSYSTGHSLDQTEGNRDRFTLRLPAEVRKEMVNQASLNRSRSNAIILQREASSRKGYRIALEEGSNRARWFDCKFKSDRWSFLARTISIRSSRMEVEIDEGSGSTTSRMEKPTKLASFISLEPSADN